MKCLFQSIILTTLLLTGNAAAIEYSQVDVHGKHFTVCKVDVFKEQLRLFHHDDNAIAFKRFDLLGSWVNSQHHKLMFAMNAGMFNGNYSPVGLFVSEGKQIFPLNIADGYGNFYLKPNGIFALGESGAKIFNSKSYSKSNVKYSLATQSGPLLVIGGKIHPAFTINSSSRHIRNGVGVPSPNIAIFVISEEPVTFYEFATLFRDRLACPDALYFDGTVSSLYSPDLHRNDKRANLGPIIGVIE